MIACFSQGSEGSPPPSPEKGCASRAGQPDRPAAEGFTVRVGGETVHTSSSRRAGRLIPTRAGRYLALGCFFGVVPAHPRAGGALLRAHRALPGAASPIGAGQSALGQVISLLQ